MLRIIQNSTAEGAKSYYSTADYYSEGQELAGTWKGRAAAMLGLSGEIARADWDVLCDNRDPESGETLTQRQKRERRVGYDFNFHVPKSVSLLYGISQDERLLDAFRGAVDETMKEIESETKARVRAGGQNSDRVTGNMVWGEFVHFTARPVGGVPDPHLHAHCFVFNTTWDAQEERWKAGQFGDIKKDAPYFESRFHATLARNFADLGLPVVRTPKGWELEGVSASTIAKFSRRTAQIEEKARRQGITDPAAKGELGAKTRSRKQKDLSLSELRALWGSRLSEDESGTLRRLEARVGGTPTIADDGKAREVAALAVGHCFERSSVVRERQLLTSALRGSIGTARPVAVERRLAEQPLIRAQRNGERFVTTPEVLAEERRLVAFARDGRGSCRPLASEPHVFTRDWLNAGQRRAVSHVLESRDRVIMIRGAAGTGKTAMMQEAVGAIEAAGRRVAVFAPSAEASRCVLRAEGFGQADTVARLLTDERLQKSMRGQVWWIDEAGLLSARSMSELFELAGELDARLILSGDRRQHGSVQRGAALRLLEEEAGVVPAELREIQRQKAEYKRVVEALADGRIGEGFRDLDRMGWVREVGDADRYKLLAADYVAAVGAGKTALVIAPTHLEGDWCTGAIRDQLRHLGQIGEREHRLDTLESANLTEAERADAANYVPGDVLVFHQNAPGITRGARLVAGRDALPIADAARFQVYHPSRLSVAAGDLIRITRNGMTVDGEHRLNNGAVYRVRDFDAEGNLRLANGWTVARDYGHLTHGYCVTSHSAQGRTVDQVFIGQSSVSGLASSKEQFYVSISRARERATVYTDDRDALRASVAATDDRVSATDLLRHHGAALRRSAEFERHAQTERTPQRDSKEAVRG